MIVSTEICTGGQIVSLPSLNILLRFKYIPVMDTDELILPKHHKSWKEMMKKVTHHKPFRNVGCWQFKRFDFIVNNTENKSLYFDNLIKYQVAGTLGKWSNRKKK